MSLVVTIVTMEGIVMGSDGRAFRGHEVDDAFGKVRRTRSDVLIGVVANIEREHEDLLNLDETLAELEDAPPSVIATVLLDRVRPAGASGRVAGHVAGYVDGVSEVWGFDTRAGAVALAPAGQPAVAWMGEPDPLMRLFAPREPGPWRLQPHAWSLRQAAQFVAFAVDLTAHAQAFTGQEVTVGRRVQVLATPRAGGSDKQTWRHGYPLAPHDPGGPADGTHAR